MRDFTRRLEKLERQLEQREQQQSRLDPRCICYPEGASPRVRFPILETIAFLVKCPLHGDRFKLESRELIYVSKWLREKREQLLYDLSPFDNLPGRPCTRALISGQHRKAHFAAFPPDLWPGVEEVAKDAEGYKTYLRLKNGTRIQVVPGNHETKLVLARLLKERGQIVDLSPSTLE